MSVHFYFTQPEKRVPRPPRLSRDIQPLSEFRANTAKFVRHVQETGRPLVLTQHGRSAAVLLNVTEYERLVERSELADDIRSAEEQLDRGEGIDHAEARNRILQKLQK